LSSVAHGIAQGSKGSGNGYKMQRPPSATVSSETLAD